MKSRSLVAHRPSDQISRGVSPDVMDGCREQRPALSTTRQDGPGELDFDAGTSKRKRGTLASRALLTPWPINTR